MAHLTESRLPAPGAQHGYQIDPAPGAGCDVLWSIDGRAVSVGDSEGGLTVVGIGGSGVLTVEVGPDGSRATVSAVVECPNQQPATAGPLTVGAGSTDPCKRDPCKSARDAYSAVQLNGYQASLAVKAACVDYAHARDAYGMIFALLILAFAAIVACHALNWLPIVCWLLYVTAALIGAALAAAALRVLNARRRLSTAHRACTQVSVREFSTYLDMVNACPKECELPRVKLDCACD